MVGQSDASILRTRKNSGRTENEGQQGTYSRRKKERKAKFREDDAGNSNINDANEHQTMVDLFVQEVIERAKNEYLSQSVSPYDEGDVTVNESLLQNQTQGKDDDNGQLPHEKVSKKSSKDKHRHRHHYKYSAPVDAKEISEYEQQGDSLLQLNPNFGRVDSRNLNETSGFYNRTVAAFRRLLGCCFGKT